VAAVAGAAARVEVMRLDLKIGEDLAADGAELSRARARLEDAERRLEAAVRELAQGFDALPDAVSPPEDTARRADAQARS
jgi:hypothetical protein